jgi:TolB protein
MNTGWKHVLLLPALLMGCAPDEPAVTPGAEATDVPVQTEAIAVRSYRMTNLTRSVHRDGYATFSPDGEHLAFSSVRNGNRDLYLMTLASGAVERLTAHPADDGGPPAWSADGATLYFRSKRDGEAYNLYRLELASGTVTRLTTADGGEGYVDVSPDGRSIAFHSERDRTDVDDNLEVYLLDLASGAQRRVTHQPAMRNGGPDWLPDGERLINVARSPTGTSVQITDLAGRVLKELAATHKQDTFIGTLGPLGKRFVVYSDREGGAIGLYSLELATGAITRITTGRATFSTAQFSPGGRYLALQYDDGSPSDIALLDLGQPVPQSYAAGKDLLQMAATRFEFPDAVALLEQAVAEDEDFAPARLWLAVGYARLAKWGQARAQIAQAEHLARGLNDGERLLLAAVGAQAVGEPTAEIAAWKNLLAHDPGDRWAWYHLAAAHMVVEDFAAAVAATDAALGLVEEPARWEASWLYYVRSKALYRVGEFEQAIAAAEPGRSTQTTWRSTLYRQGIAQFGAGDTAAGNESINAYIDWSRREGRISESDLAVNVGLFYYEIGDFDQAERYARRGFDGAGGASTAYWALGYTLVEAGKLAEGMALLEQGLDRHPDNADLLEAYGWGLYRQGRVETARDYLLKAKAAYGRYNHRLEAHLAAIVLAIANPDAPPAPATAWLS